MDPENFTISFYCHTILFFLEKSCVFKKNNAKIIEKCFEVNVQPSFEKVKSLNKVLYYAVIM